MDAFLQLVKEQGLAKSISHMATTGGGAHKFEEAFFEELHVQLLKGDEMGCLVQGVHFLINTSPRQQASAPPRVVPCQRTVLTTSSSTP